MKHGKKLTSVLLALAMLLTLAPALGGTARAANTDAWDGTIATAFAGGSGTAADPYQIATGA
ncbi:MAG: hypothetical protein E7474_05125 [Ruminococcaceae bacterium]|nr:hypothetical protein [Oscillospiraceae bacterium]